MQGLVTAIIVLTMTFGYASEAWGVDFTMHNKFGITPKAGVNISTNGAFNSIQDMRDVIDSGPDVGINLKYGVTDMLAVEGEYAYGWMRFDRNVQPNPFDEENKVKDPHFVTHKVTLNGLMTMPQGFGPGNRLAPYITAGIGYYRWKITNDGLDDPARVAGTIGQRYTEGDFGLNGGVGLEVRILNDLSLSGEFRYSYIYTKNEEAFGDNFGNQGLANISLGLTYYLPGIVR